MPTLDLSYPAILKEFGRRAVTQRTESRQFLAWFLDNYYRLEDHEIDDCICDGPDDKGIDGIYVNEQLSQIDIFQATIAQSPKSLGDSLLKKFKGTLDQFGTAEKAEAVQKSTGNVELANLMLDNEIPEKSPMGLRFAEFFSLIQKGTKMQARILK